MRVAKYIMATYIRQCACHEEAGHVSVVCVTRTATPTTRSGAPSGFDRRHVGCVSRVDCRRSGHGGRREPSIARDDLWAAGIGFVPGRRDLYPVLVERVEDVRVHRRLYLS